MNWKEFYKENFDWIHTVEDADAGAIKFMYNSNWKLPMFSISKTGFDLECLKLAEPHEQLDAVRFLAQKPKEWFKGIEKKYNVIIGQSEDYSVTAYKKICKGKYIVDDCACVYGQKEDYALTQDEIDDLKSQLPENMQKIVDLGKVEVKDDDD